MTVSIEQHTIIDKFFDVLIEDDGLKFSMKIDYDDVNHQEVDAVVDCLKDIIETHWDRKMFLVHYKKHLIKRWEEDKWLRKDYEDNMGEYLSQSLRE